MVIWSGWGFITLVIFLAGILAGDTYLGSEHGDVIGLILAAIMNFVLGRAINNPAKDRVVVDEETGERIALKKRSTLFFVPMEWWSVLIIIAAVVNFFHLAGD